MIGRMAMGAVLLLAGCAQPNDEAANVEVPNAAEPNEADMANAVDGIDNTAVPTASDVPGNLSRFTRYDPKTCKLIEQSDEGPYFRYRCPGVSGFSYELTESDLRQSLVILAPGGRRDEIDLGSVIGGGGFSNIGTTFDWRGPAGQPPRTLTVRFNITESDAAVQTSYLVVIKLAAAACPVQAIPPGPEQSARAREFADREKLPPCVGG